MKNSRRIRAIVSTPFIPHHPFQSKDRQSAVAKTKGGKIGRRSPAQGVKIARRFTSSLPTANEGHLADAKASLRLFSSVRWSFIATKLSLPSAFSTLK